VKITYIPPNAIDVLMPDDFAKLERSLPATPRAALEANLMWMVEHELDDPVYWGARILALSNKLGV